MEIVRIKGLNKRGEGTAISTCGSITVPFTLPGENVEVEVIHTKDKNWGQITKILQADKKRTAPSCLHYTTCGGCSLQHHNQASYQTFKKSQVTDAMKVYNMPIDIVQEPIIIGPHARRRVDFLARKFPDGFNMGYYQVNSRRRIHLKECVIVDPKIEALFAPLYALLEQILEMKELVHIFILSAENGLDVLLAGFKRTLNEEEKNTIAQFAKDHNLARIAYKIKRQAHTLYMKENPYVNFAGHHIPVDPNVFLQASSKADTVISGIVVENLPDDAKYVMDLFCGRGTLTLPILASGRQVYGYEGDKHAIGALNTLQLEGLTAEVRDLFSNPITAKDLKGYNAVVMNPPRSGVKDQIKHLIEAKTPTIIYVSCNPETFAKDMSDLCSGGYTLTKVIPVDQFMWSHHVEVVAIARLAA